LDEESMKLLLATKFDAWSYEQEQRSFCSLSEPDPVTNLYFVGFGQELQLREVIVGERSDVTRTKLAAVLGSLSGVRSFKTRPAFRDFRVVENKLARAWKN
jgi:hypothetical protein